MREKDTMTPGGANRMKAIIAAYWARRPEFIPPELKTVSTGGRFSRYEIRSDMVNGYPKKRDAQSSKP